MSGKRHERSLRRRQIATAVSVAFLMVALAACGESGPGKVDPNPGLPTMTMSRVPVPADVSGLAGVKLLNSSGPDCQFGPAQEADGGALGGPNWVGFTCAGDDSTLGSVKNLAEASNPNVAEVSAARPPRAWRSAIS